MTRKEKIEFLRNNGVEINDKANSSRVDKKYEKVKNEIECRKLDAENITKNKQRNKRRNERKKNEKIKRQNLKNIKSSNKRTVTCYSCKREFKRSQTVHEFLIMNDTKERVSARFCTDCHARILDHMKKTKHLLDEVKNGLKTE